MIFSQIWIFNAGCLTNLDYHLSKSKYGEASISDGMGFHGSNSADLSVVKKGTYTRISVYLDDPLPLEELDLLSMWIKPQMRNPSTGDHNITRVIHQKLLYVVKYSRDRMGTKRFKDQILAQILKTCEGEGKSKTKVVYASGLNFKTVVPYLMTLNKNGLIEIIPGEYSLYKTTPKGEEAMKYLQALEELIPVYICENGGENYEEGIQI